MEDKLNLVVLFFLGLFFFSISLANAPALFWLSLAPIVIWQVVNARQIVVTKPLFWIVIPYALLTLSSLLWTPEFDVSLTFIKREVIFSSLIFVLFFSCFRSVWFRYIVAGSLVGVISLVALSINAYYFRYLSWVTLEHYFPGVGDLSTYLVLLVPLFLIIWHLFESKWRVWVIGVGISAILYVGYMTRNRMFWPALALELFVYALLVLWHSPNLKIQKFKIPFFILSFTVLLLVSSFAAFTSKNEVKHKEYSVNHIEKVMDHDPRWIIWSYWVSMIKMKPVLGYGYGRTIALRHSKVPITKAQKVYVKLGIHGHNVFLDELSQLGIVGLFLFLFMMGVLGQQYWQGLNRDESRIYGIIGLTLMTGYLTKNMTDDFYTRQNLYFFWAMNGCLLRAIYDATLSKNKTSGIVA